jgi:uncharacterized surface protein with fasciclin (FAS1) repeats
MRLPIRGFAFAVLAVLASMTAVPVSAKPLLETASDAGTFTVLLAAIKQAGLAETLSGPGPFTIFAPSDDAFGKLPKATYEALFKPENKQKLREILTYHMVVGSVLARDFSGKRLEAQTMEGEPLLIDATRTLMVGNARVTETDVKADNGIIHVIDTVQMPK